MARVPPRVPLEADLLCEQCGYVLNGLPLENRCPECGTPIADSVGSHRVSTAWECPQGHRLKAFLATTAAVLFTPRRFYRTLAVRGSLQSARRFAQIHWWLASAGFATAATVHFAWFASLMNVLPLPDFRSGVGGLFHQYGRFAVEIAIGVGVLTVAVYLALDWITRLAAKLSSWEASYRGLRLPYPVVLRGLYFHAAHYLPVAALAAVTVVTFQVLLQLLVLSPDSTSRYLYLLCAEVIGSAAFLFHTYWIGMRNMMFANR